MTFPADSLNTFKTSFTQFSDWASFVDTCIAHTSDQSSRRTDYSKNPWAGTATWAEAVESAKYGNANTTKALQVIVDRMTTLMAPAEVPEMYLDVTTDYGWDMGTAITGNPQCGINFHMVAGETRKQCQLTLSGNNLGHVNPNQMFYRGTLAYCMYLTLVQQGYDVSIDLVFCNTGRGDKGTILHSTCVNLVRPGEILDLAVIAYACTSPSVFRRLYFAFMETCWDAASRRQFHIGSGYGRTVDAPDNLQGDIYLGPRIVGNLWSDKDYLNLIAHAERLIAEFQARA